MEPGMNPAASPSVSGGVSGGVSNGINRGILIIGVAGVFLTLANVFATVIFAALACFDTCSSALSMVGAAPLALLIPVLLLAPSLVMIMVGWVWELSALRRMRRQGAIVLVALAPLIALVAVLAIAAIAAVSSGLAPQDFTPLHLWTGGFALALWPLLVSVVAFIWRERHAPAPSR
jgi:hypothetical protein